VAQSVSDERKLDEAQVLPTDMTWPQGRANPTFAIPTLTIVCKPCGPAGALTGSSKDMATRGPTRGPAAKQKARS
jgi:hypothetical protein